MVRAPGATSALTSCAADLEAFKGKYNEVRNTGEADVTAAHEASVRRTKPRSALQLPGSPQEQYGVATDLGCKAPKSRQGLAHLSERVGFLFGASRSDMHHRVTPQPVTSAVEDHQHACQWPEWEHGASLHESSTAKTSKAVTNALAVMAPASLP